MTRELGGNPSITFGWFLHYFLQVGLGKMDGGIQPKLLFWLDFKAPFCSN